MRGSVIKRGNRYAIVYDVGRKWDAEKECRNRNQKWEKVPHPNTRKHAEALLTERLSQLNRSDYREPSVITYADYQTIWMKKYAIGESQIRQSTLCLYDGLFRNHLIPAFGSMVLSRIRVEDVQGFKAEKMASGLLRQ